ncbi:hypothetical protein AAZX31_15G230600 [Glycine max]
MAARKEKKSLRGRKTRGIRQQEKKNQRRNKKQSLPARERKPMRQWRRLREEEGEDTERQESIIYGLSTQGNAPKKSFKPLLPPEALLSIGHYHTKCPDAEGIISQKVAAWVKKDPTLAPAIIRLHFHDCAVGGCDASILLNHPGSERTALESRTLRGFQLIDNIKLTRDATLMAGGPFWEVPFGRKDNKISLAREANMVPHGHENITALIAFFQEKGLDILDLVTLSGSHTIGRSTCSSIMDKIYNFNGTGKPDPSLNVYFLKLLRKRCKRVMDLVHLDVITPRTFDTTYYTNLMRKPFLFTSQFSVSMVKLGNVHVLTRPNEGEIRVNCNYVNTV